VGYDDEGWIEFYTYIAGDLPIQAYEPIAPNPQLWDGSLGMLWFVTCGGGYPRPDLVGAFVISTVGVEGRTWGSMKALYR
jgi:hypothetical protein